MVSAPDRRKDSGRLGWTTQADRYEIGDRYRKEFKELIEAAEMVQEHPFVQSYLFMTGSDLVSSPTMPRFEDVRDRLIQFPSHGEKYFVSHRWRSPTHPDPDGGQLRLLRPYVKPDAYYWIDYSCLPQTPVTVEDSTFFREGVARLASLLFETNVLVVRGKNDGYLDRAWCFFELLAAMTVARGVSYEFEDVDVAAKMLAEQRSVMEMSVVNVGVPRHLQVTKPSDLVIVERLLRTTTMFFKLNVVMHYLSLGSRLSDSELLFGEDPYYFFSTCDFSRLILWAFNKAREHGMHPSDFAKDEGVENFFVELATREDFRHDVDIASLPKKVTLDQSKYAWLLIRRNSPRDPALKSAHNLFYILTSLIG